MGLAARRERERLEVRDKILDVARELFARDGYEGVTMRRVAKRIDYSPTVIYSHFRDKESLIADIVDEDYFALGVRLKQHAGEPDPLERLRRLAFETAAFALEHPNHYRVMTMMARPAPRAFSPSRVKKGDVREDAHAMLRSTVQELIDRGVFLGDMADAELMTQIISSAIHGIVALHIARPDNDLWVNWRPVEERLRLTLSVLVHGFSDCRSHLHSSGSRTGNNSEREGGYQSRIRTAIHSWGR
jgi:AcrR family transcriptional regulator